MMQKYKTVVKLKEKQPVTTASEWWAELFRPALPPKTDIGGEIFIKNFTVPNMIGA